MRPTPRQYAQALRELGETHEPKEVIKNFLAFLFRRGEGHKAEAVLRELEEQEAARSGVLSVEVTTAREVSPAIRKAIEAKAALLFPEAKKIVSSFRIDPEVIWGFRIRTSEALYDETLSRDLKAFAASLNS